jgi:hypothetical protein
MYSRSKKALLAIASTLLLTGCTPKGETSTSLESLHLHSAEESLASSVDKSSTVESTLSEVPSASSSDDRIYYTVMIYQSYPKRPDAAGRKDTRLDRTLRIESGMPLYTNDEEMLALEHTFSPQYMAYGGYSSIYLLYHDEACTIYYQFGDPITSDSTFYYYMVG